MTFIITLIMAFTIGFTGTLSEAPSQAPTQGLSQAPTQAPQCEEDMPCWNCAEMGNKVCGDALTGDAWSVLDTLHIEAPATDQGMALSYVTTLSEAPKTLTAGQFTVQSDRMESTWHIFQWDTLYSA